MSDMVSRDPQSPNIKVSRGFILTGFCLLLLIQKAALAQPIPQIVINELQYHPISDDQGEEYVELYNAGSEPADISGWQFSDGIAYTFPASTTIPPGGFAVVAHTPAVVEAVYDLGDVFGPFESGRLANGGERIAIEDEIGNLVDQVIYDDHAPWPELPDGKGPSLELINPTFNNDHPCSWGASQPSDTNLGTPGNLNSVYSSDNIPPCITKVTHTPVLPTSVQAVTITAMLDDNSQVATATLHHRPEGASSYTVLPMLDDGSNGDLVAGDTVYTVIIPPQADGLYIEFYISAADDEGAERIVPDSAPGIVSRETGGTVTTSYLYHVEDISPTDALPIYRLIMTQENQTELLARDLLSNVLLDATFVYSREVFYNVGVRYRGENSRYLWPRPYRVKFHDAHEFEDRERINLVSDEMGREALSHDLFQRARLPAPNTRFVTLYINEHWQGNYLDIEQVDNDFLEARFPDDDYGNLYRGFDGADLSYRGPDPDSYRPYYLKKNNQDADDYTDIIALTDALTNSSDKGFRTAAEAVADMRQWLRWFAVQAVLDNHEGALWIGQGDDYFLYHRPSDGRFILISWDHDATFHNPENGIWLPNWYAGEIVQRILNYPVFTRWYYQGIADVTASEFSTTLMFPRIDALPDIISNGERDELKRFVSARIPAANAEIPNTWLSINTNGGENFVTAEPQILLEGSCSPLHDVHVNGDSARVQYPTATTWRYTSTLWTRDNTFVITDGVLGHSLTVFWDTFYGGTLTQDTVLPTSAYPYAITEDIVVPTGITLTIEPGTTLRFHEDRSLRVEGGRLLAEGTAKHPIVLTRHGDTYWGGVLLKQTLADNRIRHAIIEYTHEAIHDPRTYGISAYGARVSIADSTIRYTEASGGVQSLPWEDIDSQFSLIRSEITSIQGDAVRATGDSIVIKDNHIHNVAYNDRPLEGLALYDVVTPALVINNHIHDISDDCVDLNHASAIVARNRLYHCGDAGISVGHPSSTTLVNNLIYACLGNETDPHTGVGIVIRDGAVSRIINCTMSGNRYGISLYEDLEGAGGGAAAITNTIVWDNESDLDLDAHSVITIAFSDVPSSTGTAAWPGGGNINADPLFRAPGDGDYRLWQDSPCVDTGSPFGAPGEDISGVYRPNGGGHDRGAHEFFEFFSCYLPLTLRSHSGVRDQ